MQEIIQKKMNSRATGILWTQSFLKGEERGKWECKFHQMSVTFYYDALIIIKLLKLIDSKDLKDIQGIFVTSGHALRALKESLAQDVPIFTVGDQTAKNAQNLGFKSIFSSNGDAVDLKNLILKRCFPEKGPLFYPRGVHVHCDLKSDLEAAGFCVHEEIVYEGVESREFFPETVQNLKNGKIRDVFLFSRRASEIFMNHIELLNLKDILKGLRAFCLSSNVEKPLLKARWKGIHVSSHPSIDALMELFVKETPLIERGMGKI